MKKLLWFSRHSLNEDQLNDLQRIFGELAISQVNKTVNSAYEIEDEITEADIVAIVAPIHLQQQFLRIAGDKPVISCRNKRILIKTDNGEDKVDFIFDGWYRIVKIEVVTEDL